MHRRCDRGPVEPNGPDRPSDWISVSSVENDENDQETMDYMKSLPNAKTNELGEQKFKVEVKRDDDWVFVCANPYIRVIQYEINNRIHDHSYTS
uniref:Uncharacterized protein n=1 Tax=Acrobeloides nanus TaxID=290746 RepID=A0A914DAP0_9BILA